MDILQEEKAPTGMFHLQMDSLKTYTLLLFDLMIKPSIVALQFFATKLMLIFALECKASPALQRAVCAQHTLAKNCQPSRNQ